MDSKQFAWTYLVENGKPEVKPTYYGGFKFTIKLSMRFPTYSEYDEKHIKRIREVLGKEIQTIGVNWNKTQPPSSISVSEFAGTFADNDYHTEYLKGTLVLLDDSEQVWWAEKLEVKNVFDMMANVPAAEKKFEEIFQRKINIE